MARPIMTICIPAYNAEKTIKESLDSALEQYGKGIEILVCDDGSTDRTAEIVKDYANRTCRNAITLIQNSFNMGIGKTMAFLLDNARSHYVIYLCADDQFTGPNVVRDYIKAFQSNRKLGIIGRYFYQYMDGYPGAIMVSRDTNILTQSCCPSGMSFKTISDIHGSNKIFIECPTMVAQYLVKGYEWTMLKYDTVKARIHPGGNTGTKEWYYTESMYKNWHDLLGQPLRFFQGYIQIKNRAPKMLWRELCESVALDRLILINPLFWFYSITALIMPSSLLKPLSNFYRHRITRRFVKIIERPGNGN